VTAHAVAHDEDAGLGIDEVRVLVVIAHLADVGLGGSDDRGAASHGSRIP